MQTVFAFAHDSLERLDGAICSDKDWGHADADVDADADVSFTMELALERIKRVRANLPAERGAFEVEWYAAASVVNLSVRVFSRPDSYYFRCLESVQKLFEVLAPAVEFVDLQERRQGQ